MSENLLELVRVRDAATGTSYTTTRAHAKNAGLSIVQSDAVGPHALALEAKTLTGKDGEPLGRADEQAADEQDADAVSAPENTPGGRPSPSAPKNKDKD